MTGGVVDAVRCEPNTKRRIDDLDVLLDDRGYPVAD
jgi:hypothetical protein